MHLIAAACMTVEGVCTAENIAESEILFEFVGELIRPTVADLREKESNSSGIYFFKLTRQSVIDATKKGSKARFLNHSCR